jgi:multidrug resistance efflux pump
MPVSKAQYLFPTAAVFFAALVGAPACVDQEKCDEAIRVTRDALTKEQPPLARQWRDRAYAICNDTAMLGSLDNEILAKETEIKQREDTRIQQIQDAAKRRMALAGGIWKKFAKLDDERKTVERLQSYQAKAQQMSKGLPEEYAKQIDQYNEAQFKRLESQIKKLAKKK